MAIDLFFYWSYMCITINNMSYSDDYLDTNSPAFTSSSARGIAIWGNCFLVYLIGGIEIVVINTRVVRKVRGHL